MRLHKEVDKKCTGCYLKTTEFLDCICALIGVCVVIRSTTVGFLWRTGENLENYHQILLNNFSGKYGSSQNDNIS